MWYLEICNDWEKIWSDEYQNRWLRLLDLSPNAHVFFHPDLLKVWIETYLPIRNLTPIFIWGKEETGNEVFFPLVLWKRNWKNAFLKTIIPVGYSDYDYHEPIFKNIPADISKFWNELFSFLKSKYAADEISITGIRDNFTGNLSEWKKSEACPYLSLENIHTSEDLVNFFKPSLRGDVRRQIRRLSELGVLSIKEYASYAEVQPTFERFMQEHRQKWANAYKAPHFHESLISDKLLNRFVHFSSLNINDLPIAWHLGFSYKKVYYYYMPVGNHEYASYSPVKVHLYYLLNRAIQQNYIKFDHLRGEENYKSGWSNGCDFVCYLVWHNTTLSSKGKLFFVNEVRKLLK